MRCTPIAIWSAQFEADKNWKELSALTEADACFVHCHAVVHHSIFLYCAAIQHMMNNPTSETRCKDAWDICWGLTYTDMGNAEDDNDPEGPGKWMESAEELYKKSLE